METKGLRFIAIACMLLMNFNSYGQSINIDSLKALLNQTNDTEERFKITYQLSKATLRTDPLLSLEYSEESVRLATRIKSDSLLNKANLGLATVYFQLENYPRTLQLCYSVIQNSQKTPDESTLFTAYNILGNIYLIQGDLKVAILNFNKALEYLSPKTERFIERKAGVLNNIGGTYKEMKEYDKAIFYLKEALRLSKQINDQENIANILNNQGQIYQHQGKNELALNNFLDAMELRKKTNNKIGIITSNFRLGVFYYEINDPKAAESYFKEAISLAKNIGSMQIVGNASNYLYELYKDQGRFKEAFEALESYKTATDSVYNEKRTRKIAQLEMQFEFDRKQNEIQAKQRVKDLYYWLGAVTLVLSFIIIALLYFLQRNKARRSKLEQAHLVLEKKSLEKDIEIKDKELATNILHLMQKNELIDNISEKLLEIKQNVGSESQLAVQRIVTDLQSNLQPELLQEFEYRFQQVHEEFYISLNEKFPNLSPSERRLCAFLKLNMTTKEISAITHQSTKTIEIARTRLRKKLNLTGTDQNLVNFLAKLN
ncbi:tetratricopeptide repeat protein [Solitalea lacus]|uniref:tetratricopeptide repeat protein n=1 Tax=Solitalea lacus TaxID=2911172 RepID=UPI001EDBACD1|nr:tetratricopeptide repeat protein [Solitalea lacus]UKJ09322.1 tetratricopeptide repeat protein [Solitalea lacus]